MKKCYRILAVFRRYYFWFGSDRQDSVIVWQNTPCTVCLPAMDCLPHWCCWAVFPDGVIQRNLSQNWWNFT